MVKSFRNAFIEALEVSGLTVAEVARRSGVSKDQLNKLKQRENSKTNVDDARKVSAVFGATLDQFLDDDAALARSEIVDLYNQLSELERRLIINSAKGLLDAHHGDS